MTDPGNALVPDASIEIRNSAKGTIQATKTDREGLYQFFFLAPGKYNLTVVRDGFRNESRAVNVLLGPPVTVNATLEIAKENTTVKVTGEAPLIQPENGDVVSLANCYGSRTTCFGAALEQPKNVVKLVSATEATT